MKRNSSFRDARRGLGTIVFAGCAAAFAAQHLACESDCSDSAPIADGDYVASDDVDGLLVDSTLAVDGDVVTIEYSQNGVTYLVELRTAPPPPP